MPRATKKPRCPSCIGLIVAFAFSSAACLGKEPPPDLLRRVAEREAAAEAERGHYTYRQTVTVEEFDRSGARGGVYREVRDIVFSPSGERSEILVDKPRSSLKRLQLTEEDWRDLREVQPLLFSAGSTRLYEVKNRGAETIEAKECFVLEARPRQILSGQRLFDGLLWVDPEDYSVLRLEGQAVPQVYSTNPAKENLFPHFTTVRGKIGAFWFPVHTHADDTLFFRSGPQRIRLTIRYSNYQRFTAKSEITPGP